MARPAPKDCDYSATLAATFSNLAADADLTTQFVEAPYAATELYVSVPASFAGGNLVVRLQGAPSTDVTLPIAAVAATGGDLFGPIRGAFIRIVETTTDGLTIMAMWQGGPS